MSENLLRNHVVIIDHGMEIAMIGQSIEIDGVKIEFHDYKVSSAPHQPTEVALTLNSRDVATSIGGDVFIKGVSVLADEDGIQHQIVGGESRANVTIYPTWVSMVHRPRNATTAEETLQFEVAAA